jgi:hypothetical protein
LLRGVVLPCWPELHSLSELWDLGRVWPWILSSAALDEMASAVCLLLVDVFCFRYECPGRDCELCLEDEHLPSPRVRRIVCASSSREPGSSSLWSLSVVILRRRRGLRRSGVVAIQRFYWFWLGGTQTPRDVHSDPLRFVLPVKVYRFRLQRHIRRSMNSPSSSRAS